jgi:hypothetical protein
VDHAFTTAGAVSEVPDEVCGDLLCRCTAALAELLRQRGRDWLELIAPEPVLAVRPACGDVFAFLHHRASLRCAAGGDLVRAGTDDAGMALAQVRAQVRRDGPVIIAGDTCNLPWSTGHRRRHAPHWFVVDAVGGGHWHVSDVFAALDDLGLQRPWRGWVAESAQPLLAAGLPDPSAVQRVRERLALGDEEPPLEGRYQWLGVRPGKPAGRASPLGDGWALGSTALELLAAHVAGGLTPGVMALADDLWVAARRRQLYLRWLTRRHGLAGAELAGLQEALHLWIALPMRLRCPEPEVPGRARQPAPLVDTLRRLAELESRFEAAGVRHSASGRRP